MKLAPSSAPSLLPPLREFEVSIIARYLSAKDKLATASLLNSSWNTLVHRNYAWSVTPSLSRTCLILPYISFLKGFTNLNGI